MKGFLVVIPARYGAQRLPGKPLLDIAGKPMVIHTYEAACQSDAGRVVIATDDQRICDAARAYDAEVVMTRADHPSGTDRVAEVARELALADDAVLVNVQADEPLIPPECINQVAGNLDNNAAMGIATLCEPIDDESMVQDPNCVKVVFSGQGQALYFSRAAIPYQRDPGEGRPQYFRHVGIYAYRCHVLRQFVSWEPAALERSEKLEQLRAMANGVPIHVAPAVSSMPPGVDTEQDLAQVRLVLQEAGQMAGET